VAYKLLDAFRSLFEGKRYLHRRSNLGNWVALHLYEDLFTLASSRTFTARVRSKIAVVNLANVRRGIKARRGDGTFGEIVPGTPAIEEKGFSVARGMVATVEIGAEAKILAKAMIKQIDRVINDLGGQINEFKRGGGSPLCVGIVGINFAEICRSYEGRRSFLTDGKKHKHPIQEAAEAEKRIVEHAEPKFDQFVILRFRASNERPYRFEWVDSLDTELDYAAALVRLSREYDHRF